MQNNRREWIDPDGKINEGLQARRKGWKRLERGLETVSPRNKVCGNAHTPWISVMTKLHDLPLPPTRDRQLSFALSFHSPPLFIPSLLSSPQPLQHLITLRIPVSSHPPIRIARRIALIPALPSERCVTKQHRSAEARPPAKGRSLSTPMTPIEHAIFLHKPNPIPAEKEPGSSAFSVETCLCQCLPCLLLAIAHWRHV